MTSLDRRHFLAGSGALVAAGCASTVSIDTATRADPAAGPTSSSGGDVDPGAVTTVSSAGDSDRVLILVQLNGGNDGLNTVVPVDGRYHDARPTIAVTEADLLEVPGTTDFGLHPSFAPLRRFADAGQLAMVHGIGFDQPDRSHFVSMDRWWRAERLDQPTGWLGSWLDREVAELGPLDAVALGGNARVLTGVASVPTAISSPADFALPSDIDAEALLALTDPVDPEPLAAAAQLAIARSVGAVEAFDTIVDEAGGTVGGTGPLTTRLTVAADLVLASAATRVIVVSAGGFDTHAGQAASHSALLADLASGLDHLMTALDAGGAADRVLVATTSEFGRRVAENGSGGTDHGAAGLSLLLGTDVVGGLHGEIAWDGLIDGDVPPVVDPRTLFTTCLDWLGTDPETVLGGRWDDVTLLRS